MKKQERGERGLLSLEASIALTIFIFLMLFMYSFFVVFEARNAIAHAALATANSLSLDAYGNDRLSGGGTVAQIFSALYGASGETGNGFVDSRLWYKDAVGADGSLSADFESVLRTRFLAYLGSGDRSRAEEVLERCHIQNGAEGLDFSGSYTDGKDLHFSVRYEIEYEFQVFNLGALKMEQKCCSKLWT